MPFKSNLTIIVGLIFICLLPAIQGKAQQSGAATGTKAQPSGTAGTEAPYDSLWKQVRQLADSEGATRSALELVQTIYSMARSQHNDPQTVKAIIYEGSLNIKLDPDADTTHIHWMEAITDSMDQPAKAILYSLTASAYEQYFRKNYIKISSRTKTPTTNKDISVWTASDFVRKELALYEASLQPAPLLKTITVSTYNAILDTGNSRRLRPTLYDLLADMAISYYTTRNVNDHTESTIADSTLFAPASAFAGHHFQIADSSSEMWKALLLYQDLLRFHSKDPRPDAYIDADLNRLSFARMYGPVENRDLQYLNGLTRLVTQHGKDSAGTWALYELALYYAQKGAQYRAGETDTTTRWYVNKALALCDQAQAFPHTPGAINAKQLAQSHRASQAFLTVEKVIIPAKPFLALAEYQNCPTLYFRLIRADSTVDELLKMGSINPVTADKLSTYPALKSWSQQLPDPGDHQLHRAEIKMDALPIGYYALLISDRNQFGKEAPCSYVLPLRVSYLSWIQTGLRSGYVLNRETSQPITGATVRLWELRNEEQPMTAVSDKNGHVAFEKVRSADRALRNVEILTPTDTLYDNGYYTFTFSTKTDAGEEPEPQFHIITDRGIYRPGQVLHFKAIGVIRDTALRKDVLYQSKDSVWIYLKQANQKALDSLLLPLDDYGAVQGEFTLPTIAGMGIYQIITKNDQYSATVEVAEYKRPRFEVTFQAPEKTYKLGDSLKLKGMAKAFSGNPLTHATVTWSVKRSVRYPFFWEHRPVFPYSPTITVLTGSTMTEADGSFYVTVPLKPDQSLSSKSNPVFTFNVNADVTDINAETHSGSTSLSAGYTSLILKVEQPESTHIFSDSLHSLGITSSNLNNMPQSVLTHISIFRLQPPKLLLKQRYWAIPDQYTMTETAFHQSFPHDQYQQEADRSAWPVVAKIIVDTFTTGNGRSYAMDKIRLKTGVYKILVNATDTKGKKTETGIYLEVLQPSEGKLPYPSYHWDIMDKRIEGDSATYYLGSSFNNLYVIRQVSQPGKTHISHKPLSAGGKLETLHYAIASDEDGPYEVSHGYVADNRFYTDLHFIPAKGPAQRLHIHYTTFTDKLEPGKDITWTINIEDPYQHPAASAVLASMYDASLDQFSSFAWTLPKISVHPSHGAIHWNKPEFADLRSSQLTYKPLPYQYAPKRYDQLINTGMFSRNLMAGVSEMSHLDLNGNINAMGETRVVLRGVATTNVPADMAYADQVVTIGYAAPKVRMDTVQYQAAPTSATDGIRSDFRETAFFYPELRTDAQGNVSFSFTAPESLTRWKLQTLAYTKDLRFGLDTKTTWTQKQLMVQPNLPRFLTEGDHWDLRTKISSLDSMALNGTFTYGFFDATLPLLPAIVNGGSSSLWLSPHADTSTNNSIHIPLGYTHPLKYIVRADAGDYSDGEQGILPVLPLRILVTESVPFLLNADSVQHLSVPALLNTAAANSAGASPNTAGASANAADASPNAGLSSFRLTLECASNPSWYAVQALPTLDITHADCTDQIFQQYYANAIGEHIVSSNPTISGAIQTWIKDTAATLLASLHKNPELTSVTLQETPWVLQGGGQSGTLGRLGLFLDPQHLSATQSSALQLLSSYQTETGGFPWTKGGNDDRATTQYILSGLGKLQALDALRPKDSLLAANMIAKGLAWMDKSLKTQHQHDSTNKQPTCDPLEVQYLYTRSWFSNRPTDSSVKPILDYYLNLAKSGWVQMNKYQQGMLALVFNRFGDKQTAQKIIASLKETSIFDPKRGRYWKDNIAGWNWYESPVSTQSQLIETFTSLAEDPQWIDQCKTWLLLQKQTQDWSGSRNTADACYALLMEGSDWVSPNPNLQISLGDTHVVTVSDTPTGYLKRQWEGKAIQPGMGSVSLSMSRAKADAKASAKTAPPAKGTPIAWGAVYYQYFQDMTQVQASETPDLKLEKQLFKTSIDGTTMRPVKEGDSVHVGDRIRVRFIIRSQRDLDYVHLKDGRAACLEPVDVLAKQKYQGGLNYYQSTGDLSTRCWPI